MANRSRTSLIAVMLLAAGATMAGNASAQPPRPKKAAEVWVKVEELKAVFKKHFKSDLDVNNYRGVSLAVTRWLEANNRWGYSGFWNYEDTQDADGNAVYGVVIIKPDSVVNVKVEELKAVFKKHFNGDLDVHNNRGVSLAINRWLEANKRGNFSGFWNCEEGNDEQGNAVYGVVLIKPDAAVDIKIEALKAIFAKHFNTALDVNNTRQVSLAVNRWLAANKRGGYAGFWNAEEGTDKTGKGVYSVVLIERDAGDPEPLIYVEKSTKRICQLTGDIDRATGKPTLNRTGKRFGVEATDLGSSFEHRGKLYFLFGDTGPEDRDVLAWTKSTDPKKIALEFPKGKDGKWLPLTVPGIGQGAFEIPSGGISIDDTMYVVFTTDHTEKIAMGRSVLASSRDDGQTFKVHYELSRTKFINVSLRLADGWLYIYGSGAYRKSSVCLARVKPADIGDRSKLQYLAGSANGAPRWSPKEADAVPLFRHNEVGEFSVAYLDPVDRYVMLYNTLKPRGIAMRSAQKPWGPWSEGTIIFDPWRDNGYGHFMHISAKFKEKRDALSDPKQDDVWGGEYGPYIMARFTNGEDGRCRIYYTMSTWNPYQVVVMRSDLELQAENK